MPTLEFVVNPAFIFLRRQAVFDDLDDAFLANMARIPCVFIADHDFDHDFAENPPHAIRVAFDRLVAAVAKDFETHFLALYIWWGFAVLSQIASAARMIAPMIS